MSSSLTRMYEGVWCHEKTIGAKMTRGKSRKNGVKKVGMTLQVRDLLLKKKKPDKMNGDTTRVTCVFIITNKSKDMRGRGKVSVL